MESIKLEIAGMGLNRTAKRGPVTVTIEGASGTGKESLSVLIGAALRKAGNTAKIKTTYDLRKDILTICHEEE